MSIDSQSSRKESGYRGYVTSRPVNGNIIPQRVQNLVMRDFAEKNNILYLLGVVEYYMDGCYMMLRSILEEIEQLEGLIFYSVHMLPSDYEQREAVIQKLLVKQKPLYFALEDMRIIRESDKYLIHDLFLVKDLSFNSEQLIQNNL